jgi:hypothetical protein
VREEGVDDLRGSMGILLGVVHEDQPGGVLQVRRLKVGRGLKTGDRNTVSLAVRCLEEMLNNLALQAKGREQNEASDECRGLVLQPVLQPVWYGPVRDVQAQVEY